MASAELIEKLVKSNFLEVLPDDVKEKLQNARLKYFKMKDEIDLVLNGASVGPDVKYFSEYYNRPEKKSRLDELTPRQKFTVIQATIELMGVYPLKIVRDNSAPILSKNQRRKENRKKGKSSRKGKRNKKCVKVEDEKADGNSIYLNDEEVQSEITRVKKVMAAERAAANERESLIQAELSTNGGSEEDAIRRLAIDQEERKKDLIRREKTNELVRCYEDVENALIDLVESPFFSNGESCANEFSNIVGDLVQPGNYSEDACNKLSSIIDVFTEGKKYVDNDDDEFYDPENRRKRCDEFGITLPPTSDQELFAKTFIDLIKSSDLENARKIFEMASIVAREYGGNLLKQKVIEIGIYDLLKILKQGVLSHELYMTELIFKVTMAMPCARKYCWRDPEYFPTLAKLLTVLDPNPQLDKFQIRGDAVHILYTSILAAPRDVFEKVANTDAIEHLFTILRDGPGNNRDAQTGEDVIMCITLFTEHWDLFHESMRKNHVMKLVQNWRKYALQYASYCPNFPLNLEQLVLRLRVLLKSKAIKKIDPEFRLSAPSIVEHSRDFIKSHNQTACSNSSCYNLSIAESGIRYKKCSKCHIAYYCSKECQLTHWKVHKAWCKRPTWDRKKEDEFVALNPGIRKLANKLPEMVTEDVVTQDSLKDLD